MAESMSDIMNPNVEKDPSFPHAPEGWDADAAERIAKEEGIEIGDDHWAVIRSLQEYFDKNEVSHARELHDALEERFHSRGGIKYLYQILPGGPVAQGCRLAGLEPPAGAVDKSFGSVV